MTASSKRPLWVNLEMLTTLRGKSSLVTSEPGPNVVAKQGQQCVLISQTVGPLWATSQTHLSGQGGLGVAVDFSYGVLALRIIQGRLCMSVIF